MPVEKITRPIINGETKYKVGEAEKDIAKLQKDVEDLTKIVNEQTTEIARLQERLSIFSVGEAVLTLIVGAVATWLGRSG